MDTLELTSQSPEETQAIGRKIGEQAQPGDIFLLTGGLGVGKTCLTQGIAWGLGVTEHARSPTFVLASEYQGRLTLYHMDLYRLDNLEDILDLGLDEYLFGHGVSVIEWAEKAPQAFPTEYLLVRLENTGEGSRMLRLEANGKRYRALLDILSKGLSKV